MKPNLSGTTPYYNLFFYSFIFWLYRLQLNQLTAEIAAFSNSGGELKYYFRYLFRDLKPYNIEELSFPKSHQPESQRTVALYSIYRAVYNIFTDENAVFYLNCSRRNLSSRDSCGR